MWVYPLKTKDEVFQRIKEWQAEVENSTGRKLKTLRTDNGGEYVSNALEDHLKTCGIRHELTIPKTPEQNGAAERLNRTLVEATRAMLLDAKLPKSFWAEAISTAVYLRNRSTTSTVKGMTPHQAWFGQKPGVKHLRVFGCAAYTHIPRDERGKLDSKSKKCSLLGYGNVRKGYRVFDHATQKVLYSRNVVFNEDDTGTVQLYDENDECVSHTLDLLPSEPDKEERTTEPIIEPQPIPRRSTSERRPVDHYGTWQSHSVIHSEPSTLAEAKNSQDKVKWMEAMDKEMRSLEDNDVWELTTLPKGKSVVSCKWVYKVKTNADGSVERHKARLVARGFSQEFGSDYDETFSPVVRQESLRTLAAISSLYGLTLNHVDITTAFLNGALNEEVYMKQPNGYEENPGGERLVCRLKKSIYGLKQSSRSWNMTLDTHLKQLGFVQLDSDPCIYHLTDDTSLYMGVYVDDIVIAGSDKTSIERVKKQLALLGRFI